MCRSLLLFVALAACTACNNASGSVARTGASSAGTAIIAFDTSTSAKEIHEVLYKRILLQMEDMPKATNLVVYRFDSSPAEIYDGPAIVDEAQAGTMLRPELKWQSKTSGTNLAKLFARVDKRVQQTTGPIRVDVYTDAGTEDMTAEDDSQAKSVTQSWKARGELALAFHGVRSGFREKIRDIVTFPVDFD